MADLERPAVAGRIRFAPQILRRLGEELNPNIDQGLIELVKNAYDADASECHVWLDADQNGQRAVVVEDDGEGMDGDDILNGWLVLGSSSKETSNRTKLGRTPAGNKGLGRLAALRLGRRAVMTSQPRRSANRYAVTLEWDRFDEAATVDEIEVAIERRPSDAGNHGTRIELSQLRQRVGRVEARRLARAMVLLADPFDDEPSSFRPFLHSDEYSDLAETVRTRYFDDAEYHLEARLENGRAEARVVDWQGNAIWRGDHDDVQQKTNAGLYEAPDARFDLWIYILSSQSFSARRAELGAVREWLRNFGGVHMYSNGIRVAPYGNPGNDWLDMNLARARNPELRPSTNTSIGRVTLADEDGVMTQKTDRSGFIEDVHFEALRSFAQDAMEWLARRRLAERDRQRSTDRQETPAETKASGSNLRQEITKLPDPARRRQLEAALLRYDRARENETDALRREVQLYRTLATAGITAATFAHELNGNPLKRISLATTTLEHLVRREGTDHDPRIETSLTQIRDAAASLGVLSRATLDLIDRDKRRLVKVPLDEVVQQIAETLGPFLEVRQVKLDLRLGGRGQPFIHGSRAAVEAVVTNLLNNSLTAVEAADVSERRIRLTSRVEAMVWELTVADNGNGIELPLHDIWLPGETTRPGGTGLGLTIVRDSVKDLNGEVSADAQGDLGGATFVVRVPLLGLEESGDGN